MTSLLHFAVGGALGFLLGACDRADRVDPASNKTDNVAITADEAAIPATEPRRDSDRDRVSGSADQEPSMPQPDPTPPPPPAKAPAAPPRREILPSPTQPPAEIDPVLPDPGDEVPR